jgi:DNA-binding GntR family transcriptional regulator
MEVPPLVSLSRQIEAHLERLIFMGTLKSGQRLSEPEIAKWFGSSRSPVREALRHLEQAGLVTIEPRRGASVKVPNRREVEDTLAVREALEGMAARLTAERASDAEIALLRECVNKRSKELHLPSAAVTDFHEVLIKASHNEPLQTILRGSWNLFRILRSISSSGEGRPMLSLDEHRAIIDAIEARDPDRAEQATRSHVRRVRANLLDTPENLPLAQVAGEDENGKSATVSRLRGRH